MTDTPPSPSAADADAAPTLAGRAGCLTVLKAWAITGGVLAVQLVLLLASEIIADLRFEEVVERVWPLFWWREDGWGRWPLVGTMILGSALLLSAYGGGRGSWADPWSRRHRRWVLLAVGLATAVSMVLALVFGGVSGGYATAGEAAWFSRGRVVERRPWSEALSVSAGCDLYHSRKARRDDAPPEATPHWTVRFPDRRKAPLTIAENRQADWLASLPPIDAALRRAGVRRSRETVEPVCLEMMAAESDMTPAEVAALFAP